MRSQKECIELLRGYFQNKAKDYGIVRMALFGSVVRNEQTEESDVDIAYEGEANLLLRSRMKQELCISSSGSLKCRRRPKATFSPTLKKSNKAEY